MYYVYNNCFYQVFCCELCLIHFTVVDLISSMTVLGSGLLTTALPDTIIFAPAYTH